MSLITRFAPSPTGYLHVGNIRTAFIGWLFARANNGKFILRIDDTDLERSKPEFVDAIKEDLEWLGLTWDAIYFQSQRMDMYEEAKKKMIASGRLYQCFETPEELELKKKSLLSRNMPPIYDRSALKLTAEQKAELTAKGTKSHWRFLMDDKEIAWHDGIRGDIRFDPKKINDPILIRADGSMTYMIATVVDDIDLAITDIIRGEDHITNSAVHIQMFEALGAKPPKFAHLSLLKSKDGGISKRSGGFDIRSLREAGIHPLAILSFLAKMGSSDQIEYRKTHAELIADFALTKFSKATATYDIVELERLNTKLTHSLEYEEVKASLPAQVDKVFWDKVRNNLNTVREVNDWWRICNEHITPIISDANFTKAASELLPMGEWDINTWNHWVTEVKAKTNRNGKELFMPIRLALTAMEHGPELKTLLPLLGREKAYARLHGKIS